MEIKEWSESQLKEMIKDILKQELKDVFNAIEELDEKQKKLTDEDKVKEIVRATIVNMHKYLWQKSSTYIRQI